ncbi:MAG: hypothetical protein UR27_C0020G0014 [Candidatus Peregrinibacteria bacterium GW2011_GWA2_33_10]|nr:MAG: hypothetical protein UR27_C0020G0014 [Candidatus Peregrinibacteria bacterium GW2011_GWA2_33_10]
MWKSKKIKCKKDDLILNKHVVEKKTAYNQ